MSGPDDPGPHEGGDADWEFFDSEFDDEWEAYAQKLREQAEQRRRRREEAKRPESTKPDEPLPPREIPPDIVGELVSPVDEPVHVPTAPPEEPAAKKATSARSGYEISDQDSAGSSVIWLRVFGAFFALAVCGLRGRDVGPQQHASRHNTIEAVDPRNVGRSSFSGTTAPA